MELAGILDQPDLRERLGPHQLLLARQGRREILGLPEQERPGQQGQPDILDIPAQPVLGIPAILVQLVTRETPAIPVTKATQGQREMPQQLPGRLVHLVKLAPLGMGTPGQPVRLGQSGLQGIPDLRGLLGILGMRVIPVPRLP